MRGVSFAQNFTKIIVAALFILPSISQSNETAIKSVEEVKTIRVLIGRINDEKNKTFTFKGQALQSADGSVRGVKQFDCRRHAALATSLLNVDVTRATAPVLRWMCHTLRTNLPVLGSLSFSDRSGFFQVGDRWYRGQLELRDTGQSLLAINHISMDDYISSLLHGEMPHHFEPEALKAQAIAARSYAIATALERRRRGSPYDILDNTKDQVYPGAQKETSKGNLANEETKNQFLLFEGRVLKSFYHAASGGYSELPAAVWMKKDEPDYAAYNARPNIYDKGKYPWQLSLSPVMLESAFSIGKLIDMRINHKTSGHRVHSLELIGSERSTLIQLGSLRKLLSTISLKSLKFEIKKEDSLWKLEGEGWGHGVGLSQIAAQNMAKIGKTYKEILQFHYPLATLAEVSKGNVRPLEAPKTDSALLIQVR